MKRPRWVSIIAIFGIVLSCLGIYATSQSLLFSRLMEFQRKIDANIQEMLDKFETRGDSLDVKSTITRESLEFQKKMYVMPNWFYKWSIIFGIIGFTIYGLFLFASLWFYMMKKRSIILFYIAIGFVIVFTLLKAYYSMFTETLFGYVFVAESLFMAVVNIVLIIVFALSDKEVFATNKL